MSEAVLKLEQANRNLRIYTPLGEDVLFLHSVSGHESMSELFRFELGLVSYREDIPFKDIVGKPATIALTMRGLEEDRYWNGIISGFAEVQADERLVYYTAELVPWMWLLTQKHDCRIFQDEENTSKEVIQGVFGAGNFSDFRFDTTAEPPKRPYCVQYRETDFDFVCRLMEEDGIAYHFEHDRESHTLVMTDPGSNRGSPTAMRFGKVENHQELTGWEARQRVHPGMYALMDFTPDDPKKDLYTESTSVATHYNNASFRIYDFPGRYSESDAGASRAKMRMEMLEAGAVQFSGHGSVRDVAPGKLVTLGEHYRADFNGDYLVTSVRHEIQQELSELGVSYENTFTCIPASVPYRPPLATPKPVVQGVQTAFVTGPSGEEIHVDSDGRIKIQFHWDRDGGFDETSSCWVRVAQAAAGKGWGATSWPRIGQEVTVEFLEGDPDRPLVTGVVYNGQNKPPLPLPAHKTITGVKTNSSTGGGGFNEIRLEDKAGSEYIFVHAERDRHLRVKNDDIAWTGNESHQVVQDKALRKVEGEDHSIVLEDQFAKVEGGQHVEVLGDQAVKVGGDQGFDVVGSHALKAGMAYAAEAGTTVHIKGGMTVVVEGGIQLSLKAGGSFVDIGPAGVSISGPMVLINSGGAPGSGSGANPVKPQPPEEPLIAKEGKPGEIAELPEWERVERSQYSPQALALTSAAQEGTPFCEQCEKARQEGA